MQQVLQTARNGRTALLEEPVPITGAGQVMIANLASVISAGTEKMVIGLTRKSLLGKARERPEVVCHLFSLGHGHKAVVLR